MVSLQVINHDISIELPLDPVEMWEWIYYDDDSNDEDTCIFNWEGNSPPVCPTGGEARQTYITVDWKVVDRWLNGEIAQPDDQFCEVLQILKRAQDTIRGYMLSW